MAISKLFVPALLTIAAASLLPLAASAAPVRLDPPGTVVAGAQAQVVRSATVNFGELARKQLLRTQAAPPVRPRVSTEKNESAEEREEIELQGEISPDAMISRP